MDVPWLMAIIVGLAISKACCLGPGKPPPLPAKGVRLYQGVKNRTIPDYAMIAARDFSDKDKGSEGLAYAGVDDDINDGLWCQSANGSSGIGNWQLPDGSVVSDEMEVTPVYIAIAPGQVGLLRVGGIGMFPYQGMYTCTIPDGNGVTQTLVVWAAGNSAYNGSGNNPVPNPDVSEVSFIQSGKSRDIDPPEFILSFDVKVAPPTYVTCQVDNTTVYVADLTRNVTSREYSPSSTDSPVTNVEVTLRTRQAGDYQCNVSVFRANMVASTNALNNATTSPISITVTDTPTNVNHMKTGNNTVQVSWSEPASNTPSIAGYEVFFAESGSGVTESGGTTNSTTIIVTLPKLDVMYDFFVVAFSDDPNALPSPHSINSTIELKSFSAQTTTTMPDTTMDTSTSSETVSGSSFSKTVSILSSTASVTKPGQFSVTPTKDGMEHTQEPETSSSIPVIAGAIVAVLLVVISITAIVVIVVFRVRRKSKQSLVEKQHHSVQFSKLSEEEDKGKLATLPVIESFPGTMTVEEGNRVKFKVCVTGTPKPSHQWYHNDQPIEKDYAHEVTEDGSLVMATVEEKHRGTYKLVVENSAGAAEKSLVFLVIKEDNNEDRAAMVDNDYAVVGQLPLEAIPVAEFGEYVANHHADNHKGFRSLYWNLPSKEDEHSVTVAITPTNKPLNRFGNITVYDDNRIVLKPIGDLSDCQRDYINASYVDGYSTHHEYIATQGPVAKTLVDFWRLVWQEKPQAIIMVTNLKEGDKIKCQQYWPEASSESFGPFFVTLKEQQVFTDYTIRMLQVKLPDISEHTHRVTQYHFTSWPDHGVPEYATSILTLRRQIKQNHTPEQGPLLVHCSAGVGRTGTFIAIDTGLDKIENESLVDISNIIVKMRAQRMKMVQTVDQFVFIFDAILESITCGDTHIPTDKLRQTLERLNSVDPKTGKTGFQQQFDVLTQVTPNPAEVKCNIASQYDELNRTLDFAAPDKHRVPLRDCTNDYINATFVNGYKQRKAFIIAQSPMENTCSDFWQMITQRGCGAIIMLCHTQENGQETCAQYWPSVGDSKVFGEFVVEIQNEVEYPGFFERTLSVAKKAKGNTHKVMQFQIINWECPGHCSNLQTIVSVQEEMYKVQRRTGNNPVVVHCSDTVSRSGMFCAMSTTIDRCKTEALVDVFQVVKVQRMQKPGLIQDVEQYKLVFDVILAFLDSFETYTNFQ